jgi:phosphoribosylformylglycinamidine synthase subunit PurSL
MRNDYRIGDNVISVPPTMMFTLIGKLPDVRKAITMDVKHENDLVYVLGLTKNELGASEYFDENNQTGISVPRVDPKSALDRYHKIYNAIQDGLVASCHDCSDGGLGVSLAESAFAGMIGMDIDLTKVPQEKITRDDFLLYSESCSRFVVTIKPENKARFETIMANSVCAQIGVVKGKTLNIKGLKGNIVVSSSVADLKEAWQKTLRFLAARGD